MTMPEKSTSEPSPTPIDPDQIDRIAGGADKGSSSKFSATHDLSAEKDAEAKHWPMTPPPGAEGGVAGGG
jgi:hypothetical protein